MILPTHALAALSLSFLLAAAPVAQEIQGVGQQPRSGTFTVGGNFSPDPLTLDVNPLGYQTTGRPEADCYGFVGDVPDAILNYTMDPSYPTLTVSAAAGGSSVGLGFDAMIVVRDPYGTYSCNDDRVSGDVNPALAVAATTGQYTIWVGDRNQDNSFRDAVLGISETSTVVEGGNWGYGQTTPAQQSASAPSSPLPPSSNELQGWNMQPYEGTLALTSGFSPDPSAVAVRPSGVVANPLSGAGCVGFYDPSGPDLEVSYTVNGQYPNLTFSGASSVDIGLIVRDPSGQYHCDDDSAGGTDPVIQVPNPQSGLYRVWAPLYYQVQAGQAYPTGLVGISESDLSVTLTANAPTTTNRPAVVVPTPGVRAVGGNTPVVRLTPSPVPTPRPAPAPSDGRATGTLPNATSAPYSTMTVLEAGFPYDPRIVSARAGGPNANTLQGDGCVGYIDDRPHTSLDYTAGVYGLTFSATAPSGDLNLIVRTPSGIYYCDDDTSGNDPRIDFPTGETGMYSIWLGTYTRSTTNEIGYVGISENGSIVQ